MPFSGLTAILNDVWDALTHALRVEPASGSFPVSGAVTANQGTPNAGAANAWPVQGGTAEGGAAATDFPLLIAGKDDTGNIQVPSVQVDSITPLYGKPLQVGGRNHATAAPEAFQTWRPTGTGDFLTGGVQAVGTCVFNGSGGVWSPNSALAPILSNEGVSTAAIPVPWSRNLGCVFSPPLASWLYQRAVERFKSAQATASGSTAVWTPAAGKKFRLLRYKVEVTGNAAQAVGGVLTIKLLDGSGDIGQNHDVYVPAAGLNTSGALYQSGWIDLGQPGLLSGAANSALNVNLSAALTSGNVRVIAVGTEE